MNDQVNQSQPLATERSETLRAAQGDGAEGLLPCPWCGDPVEIKHWPEREEMWRYEISCLSDECCVLPSINARTREAAVSAWNTRPSR